jgi:divalent metal cation (Fe/Co/Zn/Cd) transporter
VDRVASILIGLILFAVALLLIIESKALLTGEGADSRMLRSIRNIAFSDRAVECVGYPLTMYFGPHHVLLTTNIHFRRGLVGAPIEQSADRIEAAIRAQHADIRHIYLEADASRTNARWRSRISRMGTLPLMKGQKESANSKSADYQERKSNSKG